jgi:hypothetical protein
MTTVAARNRRLPTPRRMSLSSVIGAVSAVAFFQGNGTGLPRKPCDSASGARILFAMLSRVRPAGFIEPCLPSPADNPPSGSNLDSRDQARAALAAGISIVLSSAAFPRGEWPTEVQSSRAQP